MTNQEKLDEYREINRLQAQIIHESQRTGKPCRKYRNADIEYIEKLEGALDKACIFLSRIVDDPESIMSTWHIEDWKEWCMDDENTY